MSRPALRLVASHGVRLDADPDVDRMRDEDLRVRQGFRIGLLLGTLIWFVVVGFAWGVVALARVLAIEPAVTAPAPPPDLLVWPQRDRGRTPAP